jgi:hypothetical protein
MWLLTAGSGGAADAEKDVREAVQRLADAIEKDDMAQAKSAAEDIAKSYELEEVMNTMAKRDPGGKKKAFGVGPKAGAITPDGIEAKIQNMSKAPKPQAQINKEAVALAQMAYRVAAIAEVAKVKTPEKDEGQKKRKDWTAWADDMKQASLQLAEAARSKKAPAVKAAAAKLNSSCNNCHGTFRD